MKSAIYNPYLDTAGGGDKYMMVVAEVLSSVGEVDVLLDEHLWLQGVDYIKERLERLHGLNLSKVNFVKAPIGYGSSFIKRIFFLHQYDCLFYLSDGSFFYSTARQNIVHFQMPLDQIAVQGIWNRVKLQTWHKAVYNSSFTKNYIEKKIKIPGEVVYPPVSVDLFKPAVKKKQILSVGRFAAHTKDKKHEVLIGVFKELSSRKDVSHWSLHLAGGMTAGDKQYVDELKKQAKGYEIVFHPDILLKDLINLYNSSAIYWHAKGYGEDDPKKTEHFGISTVEAMAAGCVPIVINKGGQPEIVEDNYSGFLWSSLKEFKAKTIEVINNSRLRARLSRSAVSRAHIFSKDVFVDHIRKVVNV
ncbi:glycosyltransferase [Candidatus Parcubacteria bacterium]|nr:MAG: glycosyltransferase [Candidatus Parcubacteria bacterium]